MVFLLRYKQFIKYLVSGGVAAFVLFGTLLILKELFGVWYLLSSTIAFIFTVIVSFTLQKLWTFEDSTTHTLHKQAARYLSLSFFNLVINIIVMYFLVDFVGIWYFSSQILTTLIIAFWSFFIYKYIIFKTQKV